MTNHPNINWRSRWTVDPDTSTAKHVDGWVFEFVQVEEGVWDGNITHQPMNPDYSQVARISREAGDVYNDYLKKQRQ